MRWDLNKNKEAFMRWDLIKKIHQQGQALMKGEVNPHFDIPSILEKELKEGTLSAQDLHDIMIALALHK